MALALSWKIALHRHGAAAVKLAGPLFPYLEERPMINRRDLGMGLLATAAVLDTMTATDTSAQPAPDLPTPPKGPWTRTGTVQRAGGQLHYAMVGPETTGKPPIVLLHKLGGWMADWRHVAPLLAQGRQVIAFDLPGHGGSRWQGPPPYIQTLGETASLLVAALDDLGVEQIDLVGTSLGGCLSVPLAAFYPEMVRRLALVSCALVGGNSRADIARLIDAGEKGVYDATGNPLPYDPQLLAKTFGIIHIQPMAAEGADSRIVAGRWIQPSERGVFRMNIQAMLKRVEAPTLLLYGDKDKAYIKYRAAAEANLKQSQTAFVPDAGAFVMQDNPPETARILRGFLEG